MRHMVVGIRDDIVRGGNIWIRLTGGVTLMDSILDLVLNKIITITASILIGGVRKDTFQMSS